MFSLTARNIHVMKRKSPYSNDSKYIDIQSENGIGIAGNGVCGSYRQSFLSAVGEFYEREAMNYYDTAKVKAISLINHKVSIFSKKDMEPFQDSCGMASYTTSSQALENALDEFIERQSLIFNYLSKTPGTRMVYIERYIPTVYRRFEFYNISIVRNFFVIIGLGVIKQRFLIGIGASSDSQIALKKCIKEINQFYIFDKLELNKEIIVKSQNGTEDNLRDYADMFATISSTRLQNAYLYLKAGNKRESLMHFRLDIKHIVHFMYESLGMNPYLVYFKSPRLHLNQKIVKVIDFNWFPSMNPRMFAQSNYDFVEKITGKKIDRECNFIPFP